MLTPLFARVLLKRDDFKHSHLLIPNDAARRNAPTIGKVVSKGPTADESIKVGATYLFGQHAGCWVNEKGTHPKPSETEAFFVCKDEDLIAEVSNG